MIIHVKGTRASPTPTDPAQAYEQTQDPERSKAPYALAAIVLAIAAYLKSALGPVLGRTVAPPEPDADQARAEPPPERDDAVAAGPAAEAGSADHDDLSQWTNADEWQGLFGSLSTRPVGPSAFRRPDPVTFMHEPLNLPQVSFPGIAQLPRPDLPVPANLGAPPPGAQPPGGQPRGDTGAPGLSPPAPEAAPPPAGPLYDPPPGGGRGNWAPRVTGPVQILDIASCGVFLIGIESLLANASDPDGDPLSVRGVTSTTGIVSQRGSALAIEWAGEAPHQFSLSYEISDGLATVSQTAFVTLAPRPVIAGAGLDDLLIGTECGDEISAGGGNDNVDARGGNDLILGGAGDDHIVAGEGNDTVHGGAGNDIIFGSNGDDILFGDAGADRLFGGAGRDVVFGGAGDDQLQGDAGDDVLFGELGDDSLAGGDGDDLLDGGSGDDVLQGGAGADTLLGGAGADLLIDDAGEDVIIGGAGDDHIVVAPDAAPDRFDGGAGADTLDLSAMSSSVRVDLHDGTAAGAEIGQNSVDGIEHVIGGAGDDHLIAGAYDTTFTGGAGADTFEYRTDASPPAARISQHEITDFRHGDRVRISKYDLFEKVLDELEDDFERVYGFEVDEDDIHIRARHDVTDKAWRTIIEADVDRDGTYEMTINIAGQHVLVLLEHA